MATSVTLKESDGTEIYPVTDISLVNGGIHAVDIQNTSSVPPITSSMIDWSTMTSSSVNTADFVTAETGYTISNVGMKKMGNILMGDIVIKKTSGYFGEGQVVVGVVKSGYTPNMTINLFAGLGDSEWSIKGACYFYVNQGGNIYINNQTGVQNCNYIKASVIWFTA